MNMATYVSVSVWSLSIVFSRNITTAGQRIARAAEYNVIYSGLLVICRWQPTEGSDRDQKMRQVV